MHRSWPGRTAQDVQLGHRPDRDRRQRLRPGIGRPGEVAGRERGVQHHEEPRLQPGPQLRPGEKESANHLHDPDDARLSPRSGAGTLLLAVSGGSPQGRTEVFVVGTDQVIFSYLPARFHGSPLAHCRVRP